MFQPKLAKRWKVIEIQLNQAAELLHEPERFKLETKLLSAYKEYLQANELEMAMCMLEQIAYKHGAKSGFWRRLKEAAETMELPNKAEEYGTAFHDALAKKRNESINLQVAQANDIQSIITLMNTAYRGGQGWTNENHLVTGQRVAAEHIENLIASETDTLLVHKKDHHLIACICISVDEKSSDIAYIGSFAVHPDYQGSGLGNAVLLAAENYASTLGVLTYKMQVLAPRTELIAYYERRNYKQTGETTPFPKKLNVGQPVDHDLQVIELEKRVTS